ncbi:MAG: ATP-binding cassette domain-containing protein, partial [Eubacterium sp.]|nr:ATP-binding cassette domain-containing protein [Eubacterium sp.]
MIEATNLVKTFTRTVNKKQKEDFNAVDGISLRVDPGEIVGILGPNGAGKTTLLRMLCTLMTPTSGEITVETKGKTLKKPIEIKRHIGYLSANTKMYDRFSVRETMQLNGQIYGLDEDLILARIDMMEYLLKMDEFIDNRIAKLSTGQMQRAQIARCLIHDPDIYIFDEPTLGLDVISSSAIIDFMKKEKTKGKT